MSALRYLVRRIRQRAPGVPTLVGLWQADAAMANEDRLRATIGADRYTTSLQDAVSACVAHAPGAAFKDVTDGVAGGDPVLAPA